MAPTPVPTTQPSLTPTLTNIPTSTPEPIPTSSGAITSLEDAKDAILHIEAPGIYMEQDSNQDGFISGIGSGFIIDASGLAITNNHVVTGGDKIEVFLGENQSQLISAKLLGGSVCSDLAVIDLEGEGFDFLDWSNNTIEFGDEVYAWGYLPATSSYKGQKGIIVNSMSDGNTPWTSVDSLIGHSIRTGPNNSGGPLLDDKARIQGIDYGTPYLEMNGIGISEEIAQNVISQLIQGNWINAFGLNAQAILGVEEGNGGVWVVSVHPGSLAENAGIKPGDIITKLENEILTSDETLSGFCKVLQAHDAETNLPFEIRRSSTGEVLVGEISTSIQSPPTTPHPPGVIPQAAGTPEPDEVINPNATLPGENYYDLKSSIDISEWDWFVTSGDPAGVIHTFENGNNQIEIGSLYTYAYYIFKGLEVSDVKIDIQVENKGVNNNNISLICRYSEAGWYEFNIANNGLYWIYRYEPTLENPYAQLWNGGSRAVKTGKEVNDYQAICDDDQLTLRINGKDAISIKDSILKDGKFGFAVSSFNVLPVEININQFIASVPE